MRALSFMPVPAEGGWSSMKMSKKVLLIAICFLLLISLSPSPWGRRGSKEGVAFANLDMLIHAHPRFQEIADLDREIEILEAEYLRESREGLQGEVGLSDSYNSITNFLEIYHKELETLFVLALSAEEEELWTAFMNFEESAYLLRDEKLKEKEQEIFAISEDIIEEMTLKANEEIESTRMELEETYLERLFNTTLKLKLLDLSEEKSSILLEDLALLRAERDKLLNESIRSIEEELQVASNRIKAEAAEEVKAYAQALDEELMKQREEKKIEVEKWVHECAEELNISLAGKLEERHLRLNKIHINYKSEFKGIGIRERINQLQATKVRILEEIKNDLEETVLFLGEEKGIVISLSSSFSPADYIFNDGNDFTWQVLGIIIKRNGRGGGRD